MFGGELLCQVVEDGDYDLARVLIGNKKRLESDKSLFHFYKHFIGYLFFYFFMFLFFDQRKKSKPMKKWNMLWISFQRLLFFVSFQYLFYVKALSKQIRFHSSSCPCLAAETRKKAVERRCCLCHGYVSPTWGIEMAYPFSYILFSLFLLNFFFPFL
ncbi:uncharacterized protein LOC114282510 [Camellia sinensis]|uniref:uncharacterized protein LOC114282510 n=1 Tax=Camellia sinensis TaxID=4442 RepID=UPI001035CAC6|nr:uncharacterized protein LOC114282510 [Camellia sinensis]